ncbi:MAG: hypothetical protein ACLQIB_54435 [Isosphaeraceae bacterium]
MARGEFKIAKQSGPRGYFGRVSLDVEPGEGSGPEVVFDRTCAPRWQSGVRFGIEYVFEHIPKRKDFPRGMRVHVDCIEGHEVDTSNTLIAYVTANALFQALGIDEPKKRPSLDEDRGLVVFPK